MNKEKNFSKLKTNRKLFLTLAFFLVFTAVWLVFKHFTSQNNDLILYGNVDIRQVSLAFTTSERITEMLAQEGDLVTQGQTLARLDTQKLLLQIEKIKAQIAAQQQAVLRLENGTRPEEIAQSRAQVEAAQAEAFYAEQQLSRIQNAFQNSGGRSVSVQDRDNALASLDVAQARLREAQQAYRLAQTGPRSEDIAESQAHLQTLYADLALQEYQLEQAQLKAPVDSVVRSRLLEPGDLAAPEQPVYLLAINNPKWIRVYVPEPFLGLLKPGQQAEVIIDSYPAEPILGQVGYISSVAEFTPKTVQTEELRTHLVYEMRIFVQDEKDKLRLGMPATVRVLPAAQDDS